MSQEGQGGMGGARAIQTGPAVSPSRRPGASSAGVRFILREGDHIRLLDGDQVEAIQSTGNYMHLHVGRATHMIRETLATLGERLEGRFIRVHRSWLVSVEAIREVRTLGRKGLLVLTTGGVQVPVSRAHRGELERLLQGSLLYMYERALSG